MYEHLHEECSAEHSLGNIFFKELVFFLKHMDAVITEK